MIKCRRGRVLRSRLPWSRRAEMGWRMKSDKPTAKRRPAHRGSSSGRNASDIRKRILTAAFREFADKGLDGARVDKIATSRRRQRGHAIPLLREANSGCSQLPLEQLYVTIRAKQGSLEVRDLKPEQAMRKLIGPPGRDLDGTSRLLRRTQQRKPASSPACETVKADHPNVQAGAGADEAVWSWEAATERFGRGSIRSTSTSPFRLLRPITSRSAYTLETLLFHTKLLARKRWAQLWEHMTDIIMRYLKAG